MSSDTVTWWMTVIGIVSLLLLISGLARLLGKGDKDKSLALRPMCTRNARRVAGKEW
jgi:hypothetical protein